MKWRELRKILAGKLEARQEKGTKHDFWHVYCGDVYVGRVKDVHGEGEMKNHERGNVADSLKINEHTLRELVACHIKRVEYCAKVGSPIA